MPPVEPEPADPSPSVSVAHGVEDPSAVDLTLHYERRLLERITREVEERLASRVPRGYDFWRLVASVLGGTVYGFVFARVIADPQVWSGLAAITGPIILSIAWWRTGQRDHVSHSADAALGSAFTAISFIIATFAMEWGYISGLTDRTSAYTKLRSEVSVLSGLITKTQVDFARQLDETRDDRSGYHTGFVYIGEPSQEIESMAVSRGDIVVIQALFDEPPEYEACKVSLEAVQERGGRRRVAGWTNERLQLAFEVQSSDEVRFFVNLHECRSRPDRPAVPPVVGYRAAWGVRDARQLTSAERMLEMSEALLLNTTVLDRTSHDWNLFTATCNNGDGYEKIYSLAIEEPVDVNLDLDANFDAIIAILGVVENEGNELYYEASCRRRFVSNASEDFSLSLPRGRYLVAVEGLNGAGGSFGLSVVASQ